ncbi:MAG: Nif3-like dinuclear metal center hexameric protein [Gemmatimonadaceae bacterium]
MRFFTAAALLLFPGAVSAQTAAELAARIEQRAGATVQPNTVDTFKAGNPDVRVTGIAVTMMATLDVLQRAAAKGHNLIITHEPVFYSHRDATDVLANDGDPVFAAKQKFIADNGLVIWRFHDRPHAMKPDMIRAGMIEALGWETHQQPDNASLFDLPPTTIARLASELREKLGAHAPRIVGDPSARVARAAITHGFPGFSANRAALRLPGVEVLVMGEDHEWETIEYGVDAVTAGLLKGLIVLGHVPSEQSGMENVSRWLRTFIQDVPIEFIPTADPFTPHN